MATSDLDLPLLPSAEQIRRREFATVRRGYDPDQVRDYLNQIAGQVETLEQGLHEAKLTPAGTAPGRAHVRTAPASSVAPPSSATPSMAPVEPAMPAEDPYERLSARFRELIETADKESERIVAEARAEATAMLDRARGEADRISVDAQARAEEARQQGSDALERARSEAERVLSGLTARRDSLVGQLHGMQDRLIAVAGELGATIERGEDPGEGEASSETSNGAANDDGVVDPRYEDLWVSPDDQADDQVDGRPDDQADGQADDQVDIPDLSSIELDFDEDQ